MDKIVCNNCGKEVDIDKALVHQLREKIQKEQSEKIKAEREELQAKFEE